MDETVLENDSNSQAIRCDSSKSSVPPSWGIHFNERVFNEFQKNNQTEVVNSLYPNILDDNFDEFEYYSDDSTQMPKNNDAIINTYKNDPTDDIFNKTDLNVSKSNSQELDNSNLVVNSHTTKMSTNASISKHEKLLKSKLPIPSRVFKINHKCTKSCAWCKRNFAILDNANHIGRTRNNEMRNIFLKMDSGLDILSCICDRCWNFMKKTYYTQKAIKKKEKPIPVSNNETEVDVESLDKVNGEFGIENTADIDKEFRIENLDSVDEKCRVKNMAGVNESIEVDNTAEVKRGSEVYNKTDVRNVAVVDERVKVENTTGVNGEFGIKNVTVVDGGSEVYNETEVKKMAVVDESSKVKKITGVNGESEVKNTTEVKNLVEVNGRIKVYNKSGVDGGSEVKYVVLVDGGSEIKNTTEVKNVAGVSGRVNFYNTSGVKNVAVVDGGSEVKYVVLVEDVNEIFYKTEVKNIGVNGESEVKNTTGVDEIVKVKNTTGVNGESEVYNKTEVKNVAVVDERVKVKNTTGVNEKSEVENTTEVKIVAVVDERVKVKNITGVNEESEVYNKSGVNGSVKVKKITDVNKESEVKNTTGVKNLAGVDEIVKVKNTVGVNGESEVCNKTKVKNEAVVDGGSEVYNETRVIKMTVVDESSKVKNTTGVDRESEVDEKTRINKEIEAEPQMLDIHKEPLYSKKKKIKKKKDPSVALCSIHHCDQYSKHPIFSDEYIRIKQIFSLFDFCDVILIESKKKDFKECGISLSVCDEHATMIDIMTICQLCSNKLNGHLDFKEWKRQDKWNEILLRHNIPLILKSGMFICVNCQNSISNINSLSPIILDDLRQNYKKKIVTDALNKKSAWCLPEVNIFQESYINPLDDIVCKFDNTKKVKFTEPLITATYYIEPSNNEHCLKKLGEKNVVCSSGGLDLLTDPELNDKLLKTVDENLYCGDDGNPSEIQIKPRSKELNNSVIDNTLLFNIEEKLSQTLMSTKKLDNVYKILLNKRIAKIMNLVKKLPTVQSENLLEDSKDNSFDDTEDHIFNEIMKQFTDNIPIENISDKNAMATNVTVDNLHPIVFKKKLEETKDLKTEEINQHSSVTHVHSQQIDNGVKNLVNNQCSPVNTNIYLNQNVSNIENNEFNEYSSEMTTDYSHKNVYYYDENSMDLDEDNLNNNPENVSTVEPNIENESDQNFYLLNSQHCDRPINRLELRKKLRNVVYQRISNGGVKKLRLNDTYYSNESESPEYEIINFPEENIGDINVNGNSFNYDSNDIIEVSSDEDEEIFTPIDTNGMKGNFSTDKLNTSSVHLQRYYSLAPNLTRRLQCNRTLQKVDESYSTKLLALRKLSENSQEHKTSYNNSSYDQLNLVNTQLFTSSTINPQNTEFAPHNTINEEIEDLTKSDSDLSDSENNENVINVQLNELNKHIFENVLSRFKNESDMVVYLMENYRMLYNGDLVPSDTANPHASDCIHYHIDRLYQLYGDPKLTNVSSISFANPSSTKLSPDKQLPNSRKHIYDSTHSYYNLDCSNVPVSTFNNVTTTTPAMYTVKTDGKIINVPFTNTTISSEDELSDT